MSLLLLACLLLLVCACLHRGIPAAVKVMQLPVFEDEAPLGAAHARSPTGGAGLAAAAVAERRRRGGINRREQMAVMEAALGSSLSHPNILQVGDCCNGCYLALQACQTVFFCGQALLLRLGRWLEASHLRSQQIAVGLVRVLCTDCRPGNAAIMSTAVAHHSMWHTTACGTPQHVALVYSGGTDTDCHACLVSTGVHVPSSPSDGPRARPRWQRPSHHTAATPAPAG